MGFESRFPIALRPAARQSPVLLGPERRGSLAEVQNLGSNAMTGARRLLLLDASPKAAALSIAMSELTRSLAVLLDDPRAA